MSIAPRSFRLIFAACVASLLLVPAAEAGGRDLWVECRDTGTVGANHSPQDYADAIAGAPGDGAEYTPCLVAIKNAQQLAAQRAAGGGAPKPGGDGSRDAKPAARTGDGAATPGGAAGVTPTALGAALEAAAVDPAAYPATPDAAPPVDLGGKPLQLGTVPEPSFDRALSLPLPIAALAVVSLLWLGGIGGRIAAARLGR